MLHFVDHSLMHTTLQYNDNELDERMYQTSTLF
jgi:hypothetical protein